MLCLMETTTKQLLTRREAAEVAGVHLNTISRWMRCGHLTRYTMRGKFIRIDPDELASFISASRSRDAA